MSKTVIKIENLSKRYRLGELGTGTIAHDLNRWVALMRGKDDPYAKVGSVNDRTQQAMKNEEVWALRDINLEIKEGEVLGIIGKNGAGKSTLLKILSRITSPTTGAYKIKGRMASLLEVGTGFHPEMTGRENIYMNGTIMGMRKREIDAKLEEIVEFAGVAKYLDTPVKRYSSGMTVRLGFSVAAHLNSEILVVDEVLAVGDAEFQKKAIGKMQEISQGYGRTVLFVSHNMASIQNLCNRLILLHNGEIDSIGETEDIIVKYLSFGRKSFELLENIVAERKGNGKLLFTKGLINDNEINHTIGVESFSNLNIKLFFKLCDNFSYINTKIDIGINNYFGDRVAWVSTNILKSNIDLSKGYIEFSIKDLPLAPGEYNCNLYCEIDNEIADWLTNVLNFTIIEKDYYGSGKTVPANQGNILLNYTIGL